MVNAQWKGMMAKIVARGIKATKEAKTWIAARMVSAQKKDIMGKTVAKNLNCHFK